MIILGIETSCDETAVAIIKDGVEILSNVVSSSSELQIQYGGVYPELAAREQAKLMIPVLNQAIQSLPKSSSSSQTHNPQLTLTQNIDAIAVTIGPGLIGSLLVGVETAKTLAFVLNKPIIPVNHVLAHLYANWLSSHPHPHPKPTTHPSTSLRASNSPPPQFPALCLIVSGGHTDLLLMEDHSKFKVLGQTLDDAAGEAFDKTARLLGLPYPGGPAIDKLAKKGNPKAFAFPRGMIASKDYYFSFSGLKTAVLREVTKLNLSPSSQSSAIHHPPSITADLAASIQEAIVDILVKKTLDAVCEFKPKSLLLAGGVAANSRLREKMKLKIENCKLKINVHIPPPSLCTDNAAAIAAFAYFNYKPQSWQKIEAVSSLHY